MTNILRPDEKSLSSILFIFSFVHTDRWASLRSTKLKFTGPQKVSLIARHKMKIYCSSESAPHCAPLNDNLLLLRVSLISHLLLLKKWASLRSTK